jgi:4-hydroxybenzoate polyprenyltransferase
MPKETESSENKISLKQIFWTSRPLLSLCMVFPFLLGFATSKAPVSPYFGINLFLFSLPLGFVLFGVNDVFDYESDRLNPRKNTLFGTTLPKPLHSVVLKTSIFLSILIFGFSLITGNWLNIICTGLGLIFAFLYSVPPLRLKTKPPLDILSNIVGFFSLFLAGFSYGGTFLDFFRIIGWTNIWVGVFLLFAIGVQSSLADYHEDLLAGDKTIAVRLGRPGSIFVSSLMYFVALVIYNFGGWILDSTSLVLALFLIMILAYWPVRSAKYQKLAYNLTLALCFVNYIIILATGI